MEEADANPKLEAFREWGREYGRELRKLLSTDFGRIVVKGEDP